jgi:hypothetical protein
MAAMVVFTPFGLTLALALCGGPADWTDSAAVDFWVNHCADIGAPAGYALGILLSTAAFRWRDNARQKQERTYAFPGSSSPSNLSTA